MILAAMSKRHFTDQAEFGRTDLAARYRSTAGTQAQVPAAELDAAMAALERDGYVIVPG